MSNKDMNVVVVTKNEVKNLLGALDLLNKKASSKELVTSIHFEIGLDGAGDKIKNKATVTTEGRMLLSPFYANMPADFSKETLYGDFYVPLDSFLETAKKLLIFDEDLALSIKNNALVLSVSDNKAEVTIDLVDTSMVSIPMPNIEDVVKETILAIQVKGEDFQKLAKGAAYLSTDESTMSGKVEFAFNMEKGTLSAQTYNGAAFAYASIPVSFNPTLEKNLKAFWRKQNGLPEDGSNDTSAKCAYPLFPLGAENFLIMCKFLGTSKTTFGISITPKYLTILNNGQIFMCTLNAIAHQLISKIENQILIKEKNTAIVVDADELSQAISLITLAKTTGKNPQSIAKIHVLSDRVRISFKSVKCDIPLIDSLANAAGTFVYLQEPVLSKCLSNLAKGNIYIDFFADVTNQKTGTVNKGPVMLCNGDLENPNTAVYDVLVPLQDDIAEKLDVQTDDSEQDEKGNASNPEDNSSETVEETNNN